MENLEIVTQTLIHFTTSSGNPKANRTGNDECLVHTLIIKSSYPLQAQFLQHVPLELFTSGGLSYIASALGNTLYMDGITASKQCLPYTKVCVELSVDQVLPRFINVVIKDGSIASVTVEVSWMPPKYCYCYYN